jgi:hypothetical protein
MNSLTHSINSPFNQLVQKNQLASRRPATEPTFSSGARNNFAMSADLSFLHGFHSLPDELKLTVLQHAVHTDMPIISYLFLTDDYMPNVPQWVEVNKLLRETVFPLFSIPELRGIAMEAFYGRNLMLIARSENHPQVEDKNIIRYPPPSVAPLVRHIRWVTATSFNNSNPPKLSFMTRIADGTLGFENLKSVSININTSKIAQGDRDAFKQQLQAVSKIELPTRLLRIESVIPVEDDATVDELELPLLENIGIQGRSRREECWQRFHWFNRGETRSENVAAFLPRSPPEMRARVTIKSMSLRSNSTWHGEHRWKDLEIQK